MPLLEVAGRSTYSFEALLGAWVSQLTFVAFTQSRRLRILEGLEDSKL